MYKNLLESTIYNSTDQQLSANNIGYKDDLIRNKFHSLLQSETDNFTSWHVYHTIQQISIKQGFTNLHITILGNHYDNSNIVKELLLSVSIRTILTSAYFQLRHLLIKCYLVGRIAKSRYIIFGMPDHT